MITKEIKENKGNQITLMNRKLRNHDNNVNEDDINNINNNKILIDELVKKENIYKLKIKELEDIIVNSKKLILIGLNNIGADYYMNSTLQC